MDPLLEQSRGKPPTRVFTPFNPAPWASLHHMLPFCVHLTVVRVPTCWVRSFMGPMVGSFGLPHSPSSHPEAVKLLGHRLQPSLPVCYFTCMYAVHLYHVSVPQTGMHRRYWPELGQGQVTRRHVNIECSALCL